MFSLKCDALNVISYSEVQAASIFRVEQSTGHEQSFVGRQDGGLGAGLREKKNMP
jgi:hypothetical protein